MSSVGITERDLEQMLGIARTFGSAPDPHGPDEGLPWELLHDLKALVPCDQLAVSGQDTPRWEFFANQELPRVELSAADDARLEQAYRAHYWSSTCSYADRTGDTGSVWRDSDLESDVVRRNGGMYRDLDRWYGVEHELVVTLEAGGPLRTLRILFSRGKGSDFSERDLAVLTLLRPHLQAAFINAERGRHNALPLTPRQHEILRYVAAGYSNDQIARRLGVAPATVGKHLENIFDRLHVTSRAAAVARVAGEPHAGAADNVR
jgi:DNA-binding CsgD family transcriptional regulator